MHRVAVVGLGNIGSQLAAHLARMRCVEALTLVDPDRYDATNLPSQHFDRSHLGRNKAAAQARAVAALRPDLPVLAISRRVENVPPGLLAQCALMVAAVDSLETRVAINGLACRLGIPWLDCGVDTSLQVARVNGWRPSPRSPCAECGLSPADYERMDVRHLCGAASPAAPTNGNSWLGGLAAAMASAEIERILTGADAPLFGRQLLWHAGARRFFLTDVRKSAACRFDHRRWKLRGLPAQLTAVALSRVLELCRDTLHLKGSVALRLSGRRIIAALRCRACGAESRRLHLEGRLRAARSACGACGAEFLPASALDTVDELDAPLLAQAGTRTFAELGVEPGDVLAIRSGARVVLAVIPCEALQDGDFPACEAPGIPLSRALLRSVRERHLAGIPKFCGRLAPVMSGSNPTAR